MTATPDDLNKPLGLNKTGRGQAVGLRWVTRAAAACVLMIFLGLGAYVMLVSDTNGGRPLATVAIERIVRTAPLASEPAKDPGVTRPASSDPIQNARDMESEAGVTVFRPGSDAPGAVVIRIPDPVSVKLAPAPDKRLIERSRHGLLPKTGEDGATSAQVYARLPAASATKPAGRIALIVGGLGISQSATADAITRLPGPVSLAFAPYGTELERNVARARSEGHEVFLQVPMEPFDYPDNDPGPHTLLSGPKASENMERFYWTLARFTGYVGIINFMGGRFTADEAALFPVMKEAAARGLMIVDDGSSQRSLMNSAASAARAPNVKADLVLDATVQPQAIDRELARLEDLARDRGSALASATALPMTVERINRWAKTLEGKGLVLVPVSAAGGPRAPATTGSLQKQNR